MNADTFGAWLKARRKKLDITQELLANRVGCSVSAIRKIEKDERRPSRQIAELLALHLEVPPEEQTRFLKAARGEGRIQHLKNGSNGAEAWGAVSESFSPTSNIPASTSPFVGRQQESESLAGMLSDPRQRLITILGPGGIGKTRLALEAARAQLTAFEEQVYLIQLAAFNTVDSILPGIAAVLKIPSSTAEELKTRLVGFLRDKKALLVLDNFEHLSEGAPLLSELLQQAPRLKLLVTSRERLDLQGEWTFELSGLSVPPNADEGKAVYSALQLFEVHAKRIRPDLKLIGAEREAAIRICQHVDGMPLAIELAAAWVNVLSCEQIADEIDQDLDFLSSTLRDIPERHRSLRAAFNHSWKRLTEPEQCALSRLTIFQGGFSHAAAESIAGAERRVLSSLVSKSLLRRSSNGRFDLHEVIRQYASDYLEDDLTLRDRHSEYYLNLIYQSEDALFGGDESNRLRELFDEFGNLRAAWRQAIKQKMYALTDAVLDTYWTVYAVHGWFQEGIEQTSALVEALRTDAHTREEKIYLCNAMMSCAGFTARSGKHAEARTVYEECIETLRRLEETTRLPQALIVYGKVVSMMGDFSLARSALEEGVELATQNNDIWFMALGQVNQGYNAAQEGNLEYAYERMRSGLALWRTLGNRSGVAFALNHLSPIAMQLGKLDDADVYLQESLALSSEIHDRWGMGSTYGQLGALALRKGDLPAARERLEKSLAIFENLGLYWDIRGALTQLGRVAIAAEDWTAAAQLLKRAIKSSLEAQVIPQAIDAALELADCFAHQGKVREAMELILASIEHPACTESARQRVVSLRSFTESQISSLEYAEIAGKVKLNPFEEILARHFC